MGLRAQPDRGLQAPHDSMCGNHSAYRTCFAEGPFIGRVGAIAEVPTELLHALAPVVAGVAITATVAWASWPHAGCDLCPFLLQVQFLPIQVQGVYAS